MDSPIQNLHYAIGELAYSIAKVDGKVQNEERQKFHDLVISELAGDYEFSVPDIIFQIMDKDKTESATAYKWALDEIKLNSHYLSPKLKVKFISFIEKIALAYPPITIEEKEMIDKFKSEIASLKGDPVYYARSIKI